MAKQEAALASLLLLLQGDPSSTCHPTPIMDTFLRAQ